MVDNKMLSPNTNDQRINKCSTNNCEEDFEERNKSLKLLKENLKISLSNLSIDELIHSIKDIYHFQIKLDEIEEIFVSITNHQLTSDENDMKQIGKDIEDLQLILDEINKKNVSEEEEEEQSTLPNVNISLDNQSERISSPKLNHLSTHRRSPVRSVVDNLKKNLLRKVEDTPSLSHLLMKQVSPAVLDLNNDDVILLQSNEDENQEEEDDDEEVLILLDSNKTSKINHKIRFSNNIVRYLRGPLKSMVNGTMHAVDLCAQGRHISDNALQAVKRGLEKQNDNENQFKATYVEITKDWIFLEENADQGYSSPSLWMLNPEKQRILLKIQELPLCAANEWLAFVLGRFLGLPINEVQISIYENNLVTLHRDVKNVNEQIVTFMDLPKDKRRILLTYSILECMDLFDQIIQNVDRNQRNILITYSQTDDINDEKIKFKIHLIDHSACFGMGKLNGISIMASKFHSNHLAIVKFDPIEQSKQFEKYLTKFPTSDRSLISQTLNRFASITNEQFDQWIHQIEQLLTSSQYNRIYGVLSRQRDIAQRYCIQWGIDNQQPSFHLSTNQSSSSSIDDTTTSTFF